MLARCAAVKYSQFDKAEHPFSVHMRHSLSTDLLGAATMLLDMAMPHDPPIEWLRDIGPICWSGADQPACMWRAHNGWLIAHITTPAIWRDFCATFLNQTVREHVTASNMWRSYDVHELVTTILSTHDVGDAVMTCQLYEIPAAVIRYAEAGEEYPQMGCLDWAVISADAMDVHQIFNRGASDEK